MRLFETIRSQQLHMLRNGILLYSQIQCLFRRSWGCGMRFYWKDMICLLLLLLRLSGSIEVRILGGSPSMSNLTDLHYTHNITFRSHHFWFRQFRDRALSFILFLRSRRWWHFSILDRVSTRRQEAQIQHVEMATRLARACSHWQRRQSLAIALAFPSSYPLLFPFSMPFFPVHIYIYSKVPLPLIRLIFFSLSIFCLYVDFAVLSIVTHTS